MGKSHLYFKNPSEGITEFKQRIGGADNNKEDKKETPNYEPMALNFKDCLHNFKNDISKRHSERHLETPNHFDLIELSFQNSFNQEKYQAHYIDKYGLLPTRFYLFNRKGLFIIEDKIKFKYFFQQLSNFVSKYLDNTEKEFDPKIKFIKSFKLFSTFDMLGNISNYQVIHLSFISEHYFINESHLNPQKSALKSFLKDNNISYNFSENNGEIYKIDKSILETLLQNFDFIYATCSGSGAIIRPDIYSTPKREFGFSITNSEENLPIIGIIDSGISVSTPLSSLIVGKENEFNTTETSSFSDSTDHGTGVAAFAALGTKLIPGYQGEFDADARLLPIKIIDSYQSDISQQKIIDLIRKAHTKYGVRIFTLTVGYSAFPLKDNEEYSSYARMLDEITAELDILIFISTTNNMFDINSQSDYPDKFKNISSNIAPPAESMNNITIGASANNYENKTYKGLADDKDFPAIYSRKFHYNYEDSDAFNSATRNSLLVKPDIILGGGDYSEYNSSELSMFVNDWEASIEILSSDISERTFRGIGTSYSAPIAANMAAKLLNNYPELNMQTIKALIINSSVKVKTGDNFKKLGNPLNNRIFGHGTPNESSLFESSDDKVTLIIEDSINPGYTKSFPIHIPEYLVHSKKKSSILKVSSTLSFKINPKVDNQLLYCPIHLTYAIGKNLELETIETSIDKNTGEIIEELTRNGYKGSSAEGIRLSKSAKGWIQDYFFRNKIFSNIQKSSLNVSKESIISEHGTFKIAVSSAFHKQLTNADKIQYENIPVPYSLVITIEQTPLKGESLNSLYNGLLEINSLEIINDIELEADLNK